MAAKFKIEESPDLPSREWRLLAEAKFKKIREIREDNVNGQARLVVILSPPEEKRRFLCWLPERYKVPAAKEKNDARNLS